MIAPDDALLAEAAELDPIVAARRSTRFISRPRSRFGRDLDGIVVYDLPARGCRAPRRAHRVGAVLIAVIACVRMRRLLIASLFAASAAVAPSAQDADLRSTASAASMAGVMTPALSPRNANYTIAARLDPATRTITGSETITWRNITGTPAADLQFHLYWNAWKNTRSTFMRERALGGGSDDRGRRPDEWARIDVTAITVAGARSHRARSASSRPTTTTRTTRR